MPTEDSGDVTLRVDLKDTPENIRPLTTSVTRHSHAAAFFVGQIALLRRVAIGAVFEKYFAIQRAGGVGGDKAAVINYRPGESIWVAAQMDRVTVIFSTPFKDEDDVILG